MSDRPVIVWFTHDLRLSDHAPLTKAVESGKPIVPVYILDDLTSGSFAMGGASRWWLHQSLTNLLEALEQQGVKLILRRGEALRMLQELVRDTDADALYFSRNHAPWSGKLERQITNWCEGVGVQCKRFTGYLLHEPETIRTGQDGPYKVYTPFSKVCFAAETARSPRLAPVNIQAWKGDVGGERLADWKLYEAQPDWAKGFAARWSPGETGAQKKLDRFLLEVVADYKDDRDRPDLYATSRLSPHLHFGEITPLQCWHATRHAMNDGRRSMDRGAEHFLKELLWREFSYHLLHHWPDLPAKPFNAKFSAFPWSGDDEALHRWQRGMTGYPVVDAGMRELWATGWMHNRVRMIVASFLVKHLLVPWQDGEAWFWDTLVDADIGANAASWQWVAGCGADAAPYFRIFNPILQGLKFDPRGDYVRRWVPELKRMPEHVIHKPWEASELVLKEAGVELGKTYPRPMVDHGKARDKALAAYEVIKQTG